MEKPENDMIYHIHFTTWEHEHPVGSGKMAQDIKNEIILQHRHNMRPVQIFKYMKERFGEHFRNVIFRN